MKLNRFNLWWSGRLKVRHGFEHQCYGNLERRIRLRPETDIRFLIMAELEAEIDK